MHRISCNQRWLKPLVVDVIDRVEAQCGVFMQTGRNSQANPLKLDGWKQVEMIRAGKCKAPSN